jgi:heterodisulfide reductase subunit C
MSEPGSPELIDSRDIDPEFINQIVEAGADRIRSCIQCGTCTAVCPSGRRTAFRTRQLIRKALLGLKDEVLTTMDLWLCTTCYTCLERCPRQIKVTDAILQMRNIAVREGYMLPPHRKISMKLIDTGHAVPLDKANRVKRKELGLEEIPPTVHADKEALKDVINIIEATGFRELIETKGKEDEKG